MFSRVGTHHVSLVYWWHWGLNWKPNLENKRGCRWMNTSQFCQFHFILISFKMCKSEVCLHIGLKPNCSLWIKAENLSVRLFVCGSEMNLSGRLDQKRQVRTRTLSLGGFHSAKQKKPKQQSNIIDIISNGINSSDLIALVSLKVSPKVWRILLILLNLHQTNICTLHLLIVVLLIYQQM